MERIGLIGGVSWASTMEYYRRLNTLAQDRTHQHGTANLVIVNLNFPEILDAQEHEDDAAELRLLLSAARDLERAGATKVLICSNTTSNTCDRLARHLNVPLVNIIDATVTAVHKTGADRVGLLGTRFVMEREFYKRRFAGSKVEIILPAKNERDAIHSTIYNDLCRNNLTPQAKSIVYAAMDRLIERDVDAIILGCTEIPLIVREKGRYRSTPIIDSIDAHIAASLDT